MVNQILCQLDSLKNERVELVDANFAYLKDPKPASQKLQSVVCQIIQQQTEVSTSMEAVVAFGERCLKGDVVKCVVNDAPCIGEVWFHVFFFQQCFSCVSLWEHNRENDYTVHDRLMLLPTSQIQHVCTYKRNGSSVYIVPE